ncbi:MAG: hypothetical protein ABIJ48_02245 [Actinomycetota bacterium]
MVTRLHPARALTAFLTMALGVALLAGALHGPRAEAQFSGPLGKACIDEGQRQAVVDLGGMGWDVLPGQLAFATLNDGGGPGVMVRAAVLAVNADRLTILLTKATAKPACIAWQIIELPQP